MANEHRKKNYERIRADLNAEAQALGLTVKGGAVDPVLELLINGFARELESLHVRVDNALEFNSRALLRNYFDQPFLNRPAQTVVQIDVKEPCNLGAGLRIPWQENVGANTPEYTLLSTRAMAPMSMPGAFYWVGNAVYSMTWDEDGRLSTSRFTSDEVTEEPCLLLCLQSPLDNLDSAHLSVLITPNDNDLSQAFSGSDPRGMFEQYLKASVWDFADSQGEFTPENTLIPLSAHQAGQNAIASARQPTEVDFFSRLDAEHLYAPMVHRFEPDRILPSAPPPAPLADLFANDQEFESFSQGDPAPRWLRIRLPYLTAEDPRTIFSLIAVNARLACGYRRNPIDRFNFKKEDYNLASNLFEFGLTDRSGQYCRSFGQWVVAEINDHQGNVYPYIQSSTANGQDRWFTLETGPDDITLLIHLPLRMVPDVGYFDFYTGSILGQEANTSRLDILASRPANALDFPEVANLRLLVPAQAGGDGYETEKDAPDSFQGGLAEVLKRQYSRSSVWLRNQGRLNTLPDIESFIMAMDPRIAKITPSNVAMNREGHLVSGMRLALEFKETARLDLEDKKAICRILAQQIQSKVTLGSWIEIHASDAGSRS